MRLIALALATALVAAPVSAQVVTDEAIGRAPPPRAASVNLISSTDANGLVAALQRAGFTAEVKTEGRQTSVLGRIETLPFQAFIGNWNSSGGGCTDIELYAGFSGGQRIPLERINGWNNRTRFARAFLDPDGDPALQMDISLQGGLSADSLRLHLETWGAALETYAAFITSRPAATPPAGIPKAGAPKAGAQPRR
ncbi:MAG: YbjN domain-containing protein [Alphaproteobacteria bacterium]|nr:YbjN domain-containing protein [Alphaproteobacteria bacterium]